MIHPAWLLTMLLTTAAFAAPVREELLDWHDKARNNREIPVKAYLPEKSNAPLPVILFSHGLGGSREAAAYLGRAWAADGFACFHLEHEGSNTRALLRAGGRAGAKSLASAPAAIDRVGDVKFALDELTRLNSDPKSPFHGKLDLNRVGIAGHSFGAQTSMAVIGTSAFIPNGTTVSVRDPRIRAAVVLSPNGLPYRNYGEKAYSGVTVPIIFMTGTDDYSPINEATPAERRLPFEHCLNSERSLITFAGGDHMIFSGRGIRPADRSFRGDRVYHPLIAELSLRFWQAYLKNNPWALRFVRSAEAMKQAVGDNAQVEFRNAKK